MEQQKTTERTSHDLGPDDPTNWAGGTPEGITINPKLFQNRANTDKIKTPNTDRKMQKDNCKAKQHD